MIANRRFQDWITAILGAAVLVAPFVFGETAENGASWTAYVLGALILVVGLAMLALPQYPLVEYGQALLGVALFISPWVIAFTAVTPIAWMAWIVGIAVALIAGYTALSTPGEQRRLA